MKLAPFLALLLPAAALTGCFGGDDVGTTSLPGAADFKITAKKNANGSTTFSVPEVSGADITWELGDLSPAKKGASVTHTYAVKNGLFSVVATAKAAGGETVRAGLQHLVGTGMNAAPTAAISVASPIVKVDEAFSVDGSASTDPDGDTLKVTWIAVTAGDAPAEEGGHGGHGGHLLDAPRVNAAAMDGASAGASDGGHAHGGGPDTGEIAPGASKALAFAEAGLYQYHCHPHPHMVGKVLVDASAPKNATVEISEFSYIPAVARVAPGGSITFKNGDKVMHTATTSAFVPKGTVLGLTTLKGQVTITEKGTFDLVLVVEDGKGQVAVAKKRVAVGDTASATYEENFTGSYDQPVLVATAGDSATNRHGFEIRYPGHAVVTANLTQNSQLSQGDLTFRLLEATGGEIAVGTSMSVQLPAGAYFIEVAPASGSAIVYDLAYAVALVVHLDPSGAAPGGGDGHGDHAH